jgi:hypothetical protein
LLKAAWRRFQALALDRMGPFVGGPGIWLRRRPRNKIAWD